jgi:hypothetical protein
MEEVEGPPGYLRGMPYLVMKGRGVAKTLKAAKSNAAIALKADERKVRDAYMAEHGTDNQVPVLATFTVWKDGNKIISRC